MHDLQGCVAAITGASMGMGRSLALLLCKEGVAGLALCDVNVEKLHETKRICEQITASVVISTHRVDVSSETDVERFAKAVEDDFGGVHLLFNNAGIVVPKAFDRMSKEEFDRVIGINLRDVVQCTRAFWHLLLKVAPTKAAIINTSSVAGFFPPAAGTSTPYAVSKYAVRGFTEHLGMQCRVIAPHVRCVTVHPGAINTEIPHKNLNLDHADTRFVKNKMLPSELEAFEAMSDEKKLEYMKGKVADLFDIWGYSSDEAARMIVQGVKNESTRIMVGWDAVIMDWWVRLFPRIFNSNAGEILVALTSVVGRHFYFPAAVVFGAAYAALKIRARL